MIVKEFKKVNVNVKDIFNIIGGFNMKKVSTSFNHVISTDSKGNDFYYLGLNKNLSYDEISLGEPEYLPMEFWSSYYKLNATNKKIIQDILNKMLEEHQNESLDSFNIHNWKVVLDFIAHRFGLDRSEIASDMAGYERQHVERKKKNEFDEDRYEIKDDLYYSTWAAHDLKTKINNNIRQSLNSSNSKNKGDRPIMKYVCAYYMLSEDILSTGKGYIYKLSEDTFTNRNSEALINALNKAYTYEYIKEGIDNGKTVRQLIESVSSLITPEDIEAIPAVIANPGYSVSSEAAKYLIMFADTLLDAQNNKL